jgi:hypothetical protein
MDPIARPPAVALVALGAVALAACASSDAGELPRNPAAYVEGGTYAPAFDPANFEHPVPNPYFPLEPGTRTVFEGDEHVEVTVTDQTREIAGVTAIVVTDQVFIDGELVEDTIDWYATDNAGNVWYLGEQTAEYEHGQVTTTAGSWETGIDGAQPGIAMLADPQLGDAYRQEFYAGEAEDVGQVHLLGESVTVPAGAYDDVLVTEDWTPLDPDVRERKWYAPGVGVVFEEIIAGGSGALSLVEVGSAP